MEGEVIEVGGPKRDGDTATSRPRRVLKASKRAIEAKEALIEVNETDQEPVKMGKEDLIMELLQQVLANQSQNSIATQMEEIRATIPNLVKEAVQEQFKAMQDQIQSIQEQLNALQLLVQPGSTNAWSQPLPGTVSTANNSSNSWPSLQSPPSSGMPTQPSVSPDSSASQNRKSLVSVSLDCTRVSFDIGDATALRARFDKAVTEDEATATIKSTGILKSPGDTKIKILLKTDTDAECLRKNDKWLIIHFRGARMQGEQWYPIKVDRVPKMNIGTGSQSEISEEAIKSVGEENGVSINKIRWLSKPSDRPFGSIVVYLAKKADADALLDRQVMDFKGESGFTKEFERRIVPRRCFKCHKYGHHEFRCSNSLVCGNCASTGHSEKECTSPITKCAACNSPHKANDRGCKVYLDLLQKNNPIRND